MNDSNEALLAGCFMIICGVLVGVMIGFVLGWILT